jgi:lambda repressor-like predicted transcriptional regulator
MNANENKEMGKTLTESAARQGSVRVPNPNSDAFQTRIRALIKAVGSVAEVSRKCGIPESTVKKWADGISDPSRERCVALALGTGASVLWIVTGEGPMWASEAASHSASQPSRPDIGTLRAAVEVLERALADVDATTDAAGRAELLVAIYELLEQGSALDAAQRVVATMLRAASRATGATSNRGK